eukprot:scaffold5495_cov376-Prasinococcus_capsulatus_cf.AAC.9
MAGPHESMDDPTGPLMDDLMDMLEEEMSADETEAQEVGKTATQPPADGRLAPSARAETTSVDDSEDATLKLRKEQLQERRRKLALEEQELLELERELTRRKEAAEAAVKLPHKRVHSDPSAKPTIVRDTKRPTLESARNRADNGPSHAEKGLDLQTTQANAKRVSFRPAKSAEKRKQEARELLSKRPAELGGTCVPCSLSGLRFKYVANRCADTSCIYWFLRIPVLGTESVLFVRSRIIPEKVIVHKFDSAKFIQLRALAKAKSLEGKEAWGTIAVLGRRSKTMESSTGKNYMVWTLTDLDDNEVSAQSRPLLYAEPPRSSFRLLFGAGCLLLIRWSLQEVLEAHGRKRGRNHGR